MMPKWNVVTAMELIQKEKITNFTGVPLMSFELMTHPDRHKYDLSTLQGLAGGGAPRPVEHVKRIAEEFPTAPPALGYGLTETNGVGAGQFFHQLSGKAQFHGQCLQAARRSRDPRRCRKAGGAGGTRRSIDPVGRPVLRLLEPARRDRRRA